MRNAAPFVAGEMSLPLMRLFREELGRELARLGTEAGMPLSWSPDWEQAKAGKDGPEVLLSLGYEQLFGRRAQARLFESGRYRAPELGTAHASFKAMGHRDPCGRAAMFAGTPFVMLVDHRRLGPLPVPRRWEDLIAPEFVGEIVAPGNELGISAVLLLHYRLNLGERGMARLARNVRHCAHGSRLARSAREDAAPAAVSILPWIFAECARGVDAEVVWPEEGAILSPMWIAQREDAGEEAGELVRFLTGAGFGTRAAPFFCPWADGGVAGPLPPDAPLCWPGWDALDAVDMEGFCAHLRLEARRERHRSKARP